MNERVILLVEDNPNDEVLTLRALKKNNIKNEVVVAHDGVEALDYLFGTGAYIGRDARILPELVLLDLNLPKVNGHEVLRRLREECGADLVVISDDAEALALAHTPIRIPEGPAWTSPMVAIVAAQLFCYHLTRAKGIDPEAPRGLLKVTRTS